MSELLTLSLRLSPRYLNSFAWGRHSVPTRREQSTGFRQSTTASDFEALTLIPAASHSAAKRSSECRRSWAEDANRTTSSANYREAIPSPPNLTFSTEISQDPSSSLARVKTGPLPPLVILYRFRFKFKLLSLQSTSTETMKSIEHLTRVQKRSSNKVQCGM